MGRPMVRPSHGRPPPNHHNGPFRRGVRGADTQVTGSLARSLAQREGRRTMDSDSAGELHDDALSAEIKLLGALMLAASRRRDTSPRPRWITFSRWRQHLGRVSIR